MAKAKSKRSKGAASRASWWSKLAKDKQARIVRGAATTCAVIAIASSAAVGMSLLNHHVDQRLRTRHTPSLAFIDLPTALHPLASAELNEALVPLLSGERAWTDDALCRTMADRLTSMGWVAAVRFVRRSGDARFEVSCRYRLPTAMVRFANDYFLVNEHGVRLPGEYKHDPTWKLIQGVQLSPPAPGQVWPGEDLQAALRMVSLFAKQPFDNQVSALVVDNFAGRIDPKRAHVELATERAGGRIRWGSPPGTEIEENTAEHKLAILRENYRSTGRIDANYLVIDVSTYPDRFTVPG